MSNFLLGCILGVLVFNTLFEWWLMTQGGDEDDDK